MQPARYFSIGGRRTILTALICAPGHPFQAQQQRNCTSAPLIASRRTQIRSVVQSQLQIHLSRHHHDHFGSMQPRVRRTADTNGLAPCLGIGPMLRST